MPPQLLSITGYPGPQESMGRMSIADSVIVGAAHNLNKRWIPLLLCVGLGTITGVSFIFSGVETPVFALFCLTAFLGGLLSTWSPCGYSSLSLLRPAEPYSLSSLGHWLPTLAAHGVGYLVGGLVLAALLGPVGWLLPASAGGLTGWTLAALGAVGLAYGLHQLGMIRMPYPQRRAQVSHRARMHLPMWQTGLLYGLQLGLNFLTYVRSPILYLVVIAAVLSGSIETAALLLLSLNLGRFLPILVNATPLADWMVQRWMANHDQFALRLDACISLFAGTLLVVWSVA